MKTVFVIYMSVWFLFLLEVAITKAKVHPPVAFIFTFLWPVTLPLTIYVGVKKKEEIE